MRALSVPVDKIIALMARTRRRMQPLVDVYLECMGPGAPALSFNVFNLTPKGRTR